MFDKKHDDIRVTIGRQKQTDRFNHCVPIHGAEIMMLNTPAFAFVLFSGMGRGRKTGRHAVESAPSRGADRLRQAGSGRP